MEFYVTVQVIFVNILHRFINHVVRAFFKKVIGGAVTPISDSLMLQVELNQLKLKVIDLFFTVFKNEISGTEFYVTVQVIFVNISHRYINHVVRAFFKKVIGGAVTPISDSFMLQIALNQLTLKVISLFFTILKNEIGGTEFYVTVQVIFVNISHRYINHVVRAFFKKVIGGAVTPISDSLMLQI